MDIGTVQTVTVTLLRPDILVDALKIALAHAMTEALGVNTEQEYDIPLEVDGREVITDIRSIMLFLHGIQSVELQVVPESNQGRHLYVLDYTSASWVPRQQRRVLTPEEDVQYAPAHKW